MKKISEIIFCQVICIHLFSKILSVYSTPSLGFVYYYCYGNIIGRTSLESPDHNELYSLKQILYKTTGSNESSIVSINKMVLYYSEDGYYPVRMYYTNNLMCFDPPLELGYLYTIYYTTNSTATRSLATPSLTTTINGQLIITTDRYGRYSLYSHTHQSHTHKSYKTFRQSNPFSIYTSQRNYCVNLNCESNPDWSPVSIATFNIWNVNSTESEGPDKRLLRLSKLLGKYSLDVIGLQEVRTVVSKTRTLSQVQIIQKALPNYQFVYQPAMLMSHNQREEEGVALFSRFPIIYSHSILLPWNRSDPSDFHQRVCLHCTISIPGVGNLDVFVSHFSLSEEAQLRSVKAIINYIKDTNIKGPVVLMGDLNAEPHSPAIRYLQSHFSVPLFLDAWLLTKHSNGRHDNRNYGNTFCTLHEDLTKRIDYIFIQDSQSLCIKSSHLIGNTKLVPVSDHLGVAVNLMKKKIVI